MTESPLKSPSLLVCGNLTIDELSGRREGKVTPGGSVMFASGAAAYLGAEVAILGNVGTDYSPTILRRLKMLGLKTTLLNKTAGPSTRFRITRYNGSRRLDLLTAGERIRAPTHVPSYKGIHLGPVFNEISSSLVKILRTKCRILSADLQGFIRVSSRTGLVRTVPRNLSFLLSHCDVVQASLDEARSQGSSRNPRKILERLLRHNVMFAIVTMGDRGSWIGSRSRVHFVPAFHEPMAIDSTGAGDIFAGAWLDTYLSTHDTLWASAVGSALASMASQKEGLSKFRMSRVELLRRAGWVYSHTEEFRSGSCECA